MFSFHKPKIYRSISGCCICKAKSSSSRFTDSKKYENEFERCFRTSEKRSGEICNACVLLVKRWKKLPAGTQRDWRHVVDARAGPGATKTVKSSSNGKQQNSNNSTSNRSSSPLSFAHKRLSKPKNKSSADDLMIGKRSPFQEQNSNQVGTAVDDIGEHSPSLSRIPSPERSDSSDLDEDYLSDDNEPNTATGKRKLRSRSPSKNSGTGNGIKKSTSNNGQGKRTAAKLAMKCVHRSSNSISSFLDMSFWREEKICCGIIFKGPNDEVVIYPKLLRPCSCRRPSASGSEGKTSLSDSLSVDLSLTSSSPIEDDNNSNASSYNSVI